MSLILHLSDLHLGSPSDWQLDYTDKFGLDRVAGDTKIDHLERTLRQLGETLRGDDRMLDGIVVSGDLTNANHDDGYAAFEPLLAELGDRRPDSDRIVVVPGNHDADWNVQPGSSAKFKRFLDTVRSSYPSSLVSGLDYDQHTLERPTGSRKKAAPFLEMDDVAIVAISSADFSGVEEDKTNTPWEEVIRSFRAGDTSNVAREARTLAEKELRELRVQDMARVDKRQLDALAQRIRSTSLSSDVDGDVRLRIAVLHHPIGPVTDHEEIKAFETLTNLEQVRDFLFDVGFHVVLHGHKHESYLGWDWLMPAGEELDAIPRRTLVVGSPGDFRPGRTVCRLIETSPDGDEPVAGAPRLRIVKVVGARPSQRLNLDFKSRCISLAQPFVRSVDTGTPWVVRAKTADAAYQQLRDLPTDLNVPRQVISVVEDSESASHLPRNYPEARDDVWLESVVKWWQLVNPEAVRVIAGSDFNHGERLYGRKDAIAEAAKALPSSKAIALLIDSDEAGDPAREFPALTAVQLQARKGSGPGTLLDAVGVYRKQDLLLWWPVNMSELAQIQRHALETASENEKLETPVVAGRLVAVTTIGIHDTVLPQLAGTALDRAVDLRPDWPHRLAFLAAQPRPETQGEWTEALSDVGRRDGAVVLVPSIGLTRLREALEMHRDLGGLKAGFVKVLVAVETLSSDATEAAGRLRENPSPSTRTYWSRKLRTDADAVLTALRPVVRASGAPWI